MSLFLLLTVWYLTFCFCATCVSALRSRCKVLYKYGIIVIIIIQLLSFDQKLNLIHYQVVYTHHVCALGNASGLPHFSMVNSCGPLLPYRCAKPFMGTRDVPVTNCSRRALISVSNDSTACVERTGVRVMMDNVRSGLRNRSWAREMVDPQSELLDPNL